MSKSQARESLISDTENVCESRFECPICLAWLKDPILTSCGHRFCQNCIQSWLSKEGACPVDNIKLSVETDLFPDNYTRREILHQKLICPYSHLGCTAQITLPEIESHIALCSFKIVETNSVKYPCSYYDVGCMSSFNTSEETREHIAQSTNTHLEVCDIDRSIRIEAPRSFDTTNLYFCRSTEMVKLAISRTAIKQKELKY